MPFQPHPSLNRRIARSIRSRLAWTLILLLAHAEARAAGPLLIFDPATRTPYAFPSQTTLLYADLGGLGILTNAQAAALVGASIDQWSLVPTSFFVGALVGDFAAVGLPDIHGANAGLVLGVFNGGDIHVVYDGDGSVITSYLGLPPGVLGVATPEFSNAAGTIVESWVVLNGSAVDVGDLTGDGFAGVVTHELGHAINLAHSQTNGAVLFWQDSPGVDGCTLPYTGTPDISQIETMYPFIDPSPQGSGVHQASVDHPDDILSVSRVYPQTFLPFVGGTVVGTVLEPDGITPHTGINVIARNLADPFGDSVSALSGVRTQGILGADGTFIMQGLSAGAGYVLYVEEIVAGSFSTPAGSLPATEEFWNIGDAADSLFDPPCLFDTIVAVTAETTSVQIVLNAPVPPEISVSPDTLRFEVALNGSDAAVLTITNSGPLQSADLEWTITGIDGATSCQWLSIVPTQGVTPAGLQSAADVIVDATALGSGFYACGALIESNASADSIVVPVELLVVDVDLTAAFFRGPTCSYIGEDIANDLIVRVENSGNVDILSPFTVGLYVSPDAAVDTRDDLLVNGRVTVPVLPAGAAADLVFPGATIPSHPMGLAYLGVVVDDSRDVTENDEDDNSAVFPVNLGDHTLYCGRGVAYLAEAGPAVVFNRLDGGGGSLDAATRWPTVPGSHEVQDATIHVEVYDRMNLPVLGLAPEALGLTSTSGALVVCPGSTVASAPTDALGRTTISGSLPAGGYTQPESRERTAVRVNGSTVTEWLYDAAELYGSDRDGHLFRLDLSTGLGTLVCSLPSGSTDIEVDNRTGRAWVQAPNGLQILSEFDVTNCVRIGEQLFDGYAFTALEFAQGVLYGAAIPGSCLPSELRILNPEDGSSVLVGDTGWGPIAGLAWSDHDQVMYGVTGCGNEVVTQLLAIDLTTGAATVIGPTGFRAGGLQFGPDGRLFGGGDRVEGGNLYEIDPATGLGMLIGPSGFDGITGLTMVSRGLDLQFNSADLNGDLAVDLADVSTFSLDYNAMASFRTDFFVDGKRDVRDVQELALSYGSSCAFAATKATTMCDECSVGVFLDREGTSRRREMLPGDYASAYLILSPEELSAGAWQATIGLTSNVRVVEWLIGERALNLASPPEFVVGIGEEVAAEGPVVLLEILFQVTDENPAQIRIGDARGAEPSVFVAPHPRGGPGHLVCMPAIGNLEVWLNAGPEDASTVPSAVRTSILNRPNPFNPTTVFEVRLANAANAKVVVYDLAGRRVATIHAGSLPSGTSAVRWDGTDDGGRLVASGVYLYRLTLDGVPYGRSQKLVVLK